MSIYREIKTVSKPNLTPKEDDEQIAVVQYLEARGILFTAVPNSTFTKSWAVKAKNKATGLRPGLCDLVICLPGIGMLFIEMKRVTGGTLSPEQKKWIAAINECPGSAAYCCRGATEAIKVIESFVPLSNKLQTNF